MGQIDVEDQSISDNPLGSMNGGDVEAQNNSEKPTPSTHDGSSIPIKAQDKPRASDASDNKAHLIFDMLVYAILTLFCILAFPFALAYFILSLCFTGVLSSPGECFTSKDHTEKSIYEKIIDYIPTESKLLILRLATEVRLGCVALLWLVLNVYVTSFKRMTLFGTLLSKWSLFVVVVLLGHICSFVLLYVIVVGPTYYFLNARKRNQIPYFLSGLSWSFSKLLYYGLLLTLWLIYFHTDNGLNPNSSVDNYGTWTLVSLVVKATLGVLKEAVLLHWAANAILKRFKDRVLIAGFHLFFLSLILYNYEQPPLKLGPKMSFKELIGVNGDKKQMRKLVTLDQVMEVADRLNSLAELTRREDNSIAEIVQKCEDKIPSDHRCWQDIEHGSFDSFASMFEKMTKPDAILLLNEVQAKHPSEGITCEKIRKWMVDAHKNCLSVGYTLNDALVVVNILNVVLACFIVVVVILFWLLATELAKTNVLITIGSIFIAMSFMFSDICKAFFKGVIFSFVTHPFDVGDRCIIDGIEVEVKRISILTTTCIKIGTEEKMLYPNSDLSNKLIINLESKPDPTDLIEMALDPSTKSDQIESVRKSIEEFIDGCSNHIYQSYHRVMVKERGNSIIMSIRFKHILNAEDMTHSKCFDKKNRQRYELFIRIKKFLEDQHIDSQTLP